MPEQQFIDAELTCEEVEELLPLIADGVLEPDDDPAVFNHLARCPDCQQSLATYDLIDLAMSQSQDSAQSDAKSNDDSKVIHMYRLPWAAAAAWLLCAGGATGLWLSTGTNNVGSNVDSLPSATAKNTNTTSIDILEVKAANRGPAKVILRMGDKIIEATTADSISLQEVIKNQDTSADKKTVVPVMMRRR